MRLLSFFLLLLITSCNDSKKAPDVSEINIPLTTNRFERELFSLKPEEFSFNLERLVAKYPSFGENFLTTILSTDPRWSPDSTAAYVSGFVSSYRAVFDTSEKVFADFTPYENDIKKSLQFLAHYFPEYKFPRKIITYIGPMDGFGDILSEDAIIIGLHSHLGKNYSAYKTSWVQETYPAYISNRFEPSYIAVNCMKNIVSDMFPEKFEDKTLIVQMIEKGKRLYVLQKLLPGREENVLIGYTAQQMKDSYANEKQVWDLFVQNNFLQTIDNNLVKNYIGDGPKTQELGEGSPGNIGSFAGWQIVKKYMAKFPETTLQALMNTDADAILKEARYKP